MNKSTQATHHYIILFLFFFNLSIHVLSVCWGRSPRIISVIPASLPNKSSLPSSLNRPLFLTLSNVLHTCDYMFGIFILPFDMIGVKKNIVFTLHSLKRKRTVLVNHIIYYLLCFFFCNNDNLKIKLLIIISYY